MAVIEPEPDELPELSEPTERPMSPMEIWLLYVACFGVSVLVVFWTLGLV